MKKRLCVTLAIFVILAFTGCSMLRYVSMEAEDMQNLPDDEMIAALLMQLGAEEFASLNESQKVVYTAAALEMEILNGGMVQFLSNEAANAAPYVCEALEKIGATEHLALLQADLQKNRVDLADLSAFNTFNMDAFSKLYEQYDFETFDSAYEALPSVPEYIRAYMQAHIEDF